MKKIYISADTEGLNGITSFKQVLPEYTIDYAQMQPQLHLELNALIKGLKKAGINDITVNDAHNTMTNIILSLLPDDITLISGKPKKVSMMYGLDNSFDGVIFFAYHAKASSSGVLAHTFNMFFKNVWLNGEKISEAKLNGIYANIIGVPIILASGDNVFCKEIKSDIGNITTIQTKQAINHTSAICKKNNELLLEYENTAKNINNLPTFNYTQSKHYEMKIELENNILSKEIAKALNLNVKDEFIIVSSDNYVDIYTTLQSISKETTLRKNQIQQV